MVSDSSSQASGEKLVTLGFSMPFSIFVKYFPCSVFAHTAEQTEFFSINFLIVHMTSLLVLDLILLIEVMQKIYSG
jgi:hypothetical protein